MADITLLDGGMGQELVRRSGDVPTPLWSTQVMIDHPGLVADVHRDFTAAGATIATANTYALHRDRLVDHPLAPRFADLHAMALAEARISKPHRIAGALGPLGASYRSDIHPPLEHSVPLYAEIAQMIGPSCDVMICETVVSALHAEAALRGAAASGKPVWIAFSVDDSDGTRLRSGEALVDVLPLAQAGAEAILINCSAPEAIPAALAVLKESGLPYGAYANGFEQISDGFLTDKPTVDALSARRDFTPAMYADHAMAWVDAGATIIGGCCEVGPDHIKEMATRLHAAGHTIV